MKNLWKQNDDGTWDAAPGSHINNTIAEAIELARTEQNPVSFTFNGVIVTVAGDSDPGLIYRDWDRALSGYVPKSVGPRPAAVLSDEEKASDAAIKAVNDAEAAARYAEWERKAAEKAAATQKLLDAAGPMRFSDKKAWDATCEKNRDGYGGGVMTFAERWARLMQAEIAAGKTLADVAKETSHAADTEGITGFMYGCAVSMLAEVWQHGEELRRWHNKDTQIGTEGDRANEAGGVLNPALLNISSK